MTKVVITSSSPSFRHDISVRTHQFHTDVPKALKGNDSAPTPHELALAGLGACTLITIEMYAQVKKLDLRKATITVTEETVDDNANPDGKICRISEDIVLEGNLTPQEIQQLQEVAKRCPVYKLLTEPKTITTNIILAGSNDHKTNK